MTDRAAVEAAYAEGKDSQPGDVNPYSGKAVLARLWRDGHREAMQAMRERRSRGV